MSSTWDAAGPGEGATQAEWSNWYEMSAQKQASASPYAFSEWANGLRQRQLEDIDDAAYGIAMVGQQPQRFRGLRKIGIETGGVPLSEWGRQMQQLITQRDHKFEQDFLSEQRQLERQKGGKKRKGKEKAAAGGRLPSLALRAPSVSPEGTQVLRFDTEYEVLDNSCAGEQDQSTTTLEAEAKEEEEEEEEDVPLSFFLTAVDRAESEAADASPTPLAAGGGGVGAAAVNVERDGENDIGSEAHEKLSALNLEELEVNVPETPFLPFPVNSVASANGVDVMDATAEELASARATLAEVKALRSSGGAAAAAAAAAAGEDALSIGRTSPLLALDAKNTLIPMSPEKRQMYLRRLHLRRSRSISPTKMVTADSISTGLKRWGSDLQQGVEPLEQVELHGFKIKKPPPVRNNTPANQMFVDMLQGVQNANNPVAKSHIVSSDSAWREHHAKMGHKLVTIHKLPGQPLGFQFVSDVRALGAVVTYVTPGGRSSNLLFPGDRILEIDGHEVSHAPHNTILRLLTQPNPTLELVIEPLPVNRKPPALPPI